MTQYREYQGLHGETIRVPEERIGSAPYRHGFAQYPFARAADELGGRRDTFAKMALHRFWIEAVLRAEVRRARFYKASC